MGTNDSAILILPPEYEGLTIKVHNNTGFGDMAFSQTAPEFIDGRWVVDIVLEKAKPFPRIHEPEDTPRIKDFDFTED